MAHLRRSQNNDYSTRAIIRLPRESPASYACGLADIEPTHYSKKRWAKNLLFRIVCQKILIPTLHIKLGLMMQFLKTLNTDAQCFKCLFLGIN